MTQFHEPDAYPIVLGEKLQVLHRRETGSFENRWISLRVLNQILTRYLADLGVAVVKKFDKLGIV